MNLLLLGESDRTDETDVYRITGRRAVHIYGVLHSHPGDLLRAAVPGGLIGSAEVISSDRETALIRCSVFDREPPEKNHIVPVISLPRPQSFKKTLHFIASSGIAKAFFVGSAKVEKSYWKSSAMAPEAIESELLEGLEQGVDSVMPEVVFYPSLRDFFFREADFLEQSERRLIAHPEPDAPPCPHSLDARGNIVLAVGPEGGYTPREVEIFQNHGFECITLGRHILRVEFALSVLCGKLVP